MILSQNYLLKNKKLEDNIKRNSLNNNFNVISKELTNFNNYVKDIKKNKDNTETLYYFLSESFKTSKISYKQSFDILINSYKSNHFDLDTIKYKDLCLEFEKNWDNFDSFINNYSKNKNNRKTIKLSKKSIVMTDFNDLDDCNSYTTKKNTELFIN